MGNLLFRTAKTLLIGVGCLVILPISLAKAITVQEIPNPRLVNGGWISDRADILSPQTEIQINRQIDRLEQKNGAEIAVVTLDSTQPSISPRVFARELFNYWGIGKAQANNGVLLLVTVEERRVEIITGRGIKHKLSDRKVQAIIDEEITPFYRTQDFDRGTLMGVNATISVLDSPNRFWQFFVFGGLGIATFWRLINRYRAEKNKILLEPGKSFKCTESDRYRKVYCAQCNQLMSKVDSPALTKPQKVAQKLGSTTYRGYQCANCQSKIYSVVSYVSKSKRFGTCPSCQVQTLTTSQKKLREGIRYRQKCHYCDYESEYLKKTSRPRRRRSSSSNYDDYNYDYSSSGSSYGGDYDSGGSDFGGGSCDDGGAGGDF